MNWSHDYKTWVVSYEKSTDVKLKTTKYIQNDVTVNNMAYVCFEWDNLLRIRL